MDRSKVIFGNKMSESAYRKAVRAKENFIKKYAEIKNCLQYVLKFDCFALQLGA